MTAHRCLRTLGSARHMKSVGTEGGELSRNKCERFMRSSPGEGGGERRVIWAALSRSKMVMGPPHCGQVHREWGGKVAAGPSPFPGGGGCAGVEDAAAEYVLERTSLVYFFANQIPLLDLANLENPATAELAPLT